MSEALDLIDAIVSLLGRAVTAADVAHHLGGTVQDLGSTLIVSDTPIGGAHVVKAVDSELPSYVTFTLSDHLAVADLEHHLGAGRWRPGEEDGSGQSLLFRIEAGDAADVVVLARVRSGADAAHEVLLRRDAR